MKQTEVSKKIEELKEMKLNKKIQFYLNGFNDNKIERKDTWTIDEKSLLIHSILTDRIVPFIYVKVDNDMYSIIDGKKRLSAIFEYINNGFAISCNCYDLNGNALRDKAFRNLTPNQQYLINNYKLKIIEQTGTTAEAIDTFIRCNNGTPVKPIELFRAKIGEHLSLLKEICNHKLFALLELGGNDTFKNYEMALYFLMLETNPGIGLAKKEKEEFVRQIANVKTFNSKIRRNILKKLDYLFNVFNNHEYNDLSKGDKYLKKSHIIIIYRLLNIALEKKITEEDFFDWSNSFFYVNKNMKNTYWIESSRGSTTAKSSMDIRYEELKYNFELYFSEEYGLSIAK